MKVQFTSANLLARSGLALSVIALFAAVIVLAGCSSPPRVGATDVNCDLIEGKAFSSLFKQPPENLALYLKGAFTTIVEEASQPIPTTNSVMQKSYYNWSSEEGIYQLSAFDRQPRFVYLTFGDKKSPALGRVIECLGAPSYYSMRYGSAGDAAPFVIGELFFTDRGVIVNVQVENAEINGAGSQQNPIRSVTGSTPVRTMQWVEPNHDVETMDWLATLDEWLPGETSRQAFTQQRLDYYSTIRPWPGEIDKMELTYVVPYLLPVLTDESPLQPTDTP